VGSWGEEGRVNRGSVFEKRVAGVSRDERADQASLIRSSEVYREKGRNRQNLTQP